MKKLFKSMFVLTALAGSMLVTSCNKDEDEPAKEYAAPTLVVNDNAKKSTSSMSIQTFTIKVDAKADTDRKIKKISITRTKSSSSTISVFDSTFDVKDVLYNYVDQIGELTLDDGDVVAYSIKAEDDKGKSTTDSAIVTIASMATSPQIYLGAPSSTNTYKFLGTQDNFRRYNIGTTGDDLAKNNSAKVDFVYFYSTSGSVMNALYSPDYPFAAGEGWNAEISTWPTKNNTLYKLTTLTSSYFDGLVGSTFLTELATIDFSTGTQNKVGNMGVGQVIAYIKKSDGKRGFIKVGNTAGSATGQILLVVKSEM